MRILYVEPFEGGSHASFTRSLTGGIEARWTTLTLPGRHWKWRMRGFAAWAALEHREVLEGDHDLLFASSYVPLAELIGLCPTLARRPTVLYFHENQLTYPDQGGETKARDHHFGFTQLVSALAATRCVFNSAHNRDGFLEAGAALLAKMPDAVPRGWIDRIAARSEVLGVPVPLPDEAPRPECPPDDPSRASGPVILWNHRWEHDKRPDRFFAALRALLDAEVPFRVAVCGQRYRRVPPVFEQAQKWLGDRVVHWGYCETGEAYREVLGRAHIAVSTADHEFFGIAMLEAAHAGAYPLVPDRLSYPELFAAEYRYDSDDDLVRRLGEQCRAWCEGGALRADRRAMTRPHADSQVLPRYEALLRATIADG
ncbi:MAG: DUF3524 domain-containing protein [Myxococcota bacterium]